MVCAVSDKRLPPEFQDDDLGAQRHGNREGRAEERVRLASSRKDSPTLKSADRPGPSAGRSLLARLERTRPKQRIALVGCAVVAAFAVGVALGSGAQGSDDAVAAAPPSSAAARPDAIATVGAATAAPVDVQETAVPEASDTPEATYEPEATTRGLESSAARLACQRFGQIAFPYGFKDHSILGVINEEIVRNRWFIKHEVTITNGYDAKRDTVFECTVGGTSANPKVTEFHVYN